MAFIIKQAIQNKFNRCADMLEKFDEPEIKAIYTYIALVNQIGNSYPISDTPDRVCIFKYLSDLKNNKNEVEEYAVFDRFSHIEAVMTGITLHVLELNKNNE